VTRRAFTLLEMLFATILFCLLVSLVYGSYIYCARTITRCQEGYAPFRDGLRLQKLISRMLASASSAKQRNVKATFEGDETRLSFTTLNRQGFDPEHPWPLAYVKISGDRESGLSVLTHPTWFLLDKDKPENGQTTTFPTAKGLKVEYQDGRDWIHEWDVAKKGKLPRAVRFEVKLSEGASELTWSFEVPLVVQPDLPIVGIPGAPGQAVPGQPGFAPGTLPPPANAPLVPPPPLPGSAPFNPGVGQ
jgi:prepilin-type N-terminal cleavage/methylation domain-containing protein